MTTKPPLVAYCWRSGLIELGVESPFGAAYLGQQHPKQTMNEFRGMISGMARHSKTKPTKLLVPGIPEADSDQEATEALERFCHGIRVRQEKL